MRTRLEVLLVAPVVGSVREVVGVTATDLGGARSRDWGAVDTTLGIVKRINTVVVIRAQKSNKRLEVGARDRLERRGASSSRFIRSEYDVDAELDTGDGIPPDVMSAVRVGGTPSTITTSRTRRTRLIGHDG